MINVLLIGAPGSGKGTLANYIADILELTHLSTGELFRFHMSNETEIGKEVKALINAGGLASNDTTVDMINEFIRINWYKGKRNGFIFDGFPRTLEQLGLLNDICSNHDFKINLTFYLEVTEDVLMERLKKRATIEDRPEDADVEYSKTRIKLFNERTLPLIDAMIENGETTPSEDIYKIDGSKSIDAVRCEVASIIIKYLMKHNLFY